MAMDPQNGEPEIKVTDRRRFTTEGDPVEAPEEPLPASPAADAEAPRMDAPREEVPREAIPLPPANFATLVISLRLEAEMQLSLYPGQQESGHPPDLEGARHTIDLLGVLEEKTRGNLSLEEKLLLENSLTELRFRYVQTLDKYTKKK